MNIAVSNVYQKMGFFPGAHGIPDISRLEDDGNSRNIDLPYSKVNHLKVATHQQYLWNGVQLSGDFGYQFNHREEWSAFHTHYDTQVMPAKDPDRELVFKLHTFSSSLKLRLFNSSSWEHMAGWNMQIQKNDEEHSLPAFVKGESGPHLPKLDEKWTQPQIGRAHV